LQVIHLLTGVTPISACVAIQRSFTSISAMGLVKDALDRTVLHGQAAAVGRDHRHQPRCKPLQVLGAAALLLAAQTCSCALGLVLILCSQVCATVRVAALVSAIRISDFCEKEFQPRLKHGRLGTQEWLCGA
jgi:hypothetical protein